MDKPIPKPTRKRKNPYFVKSADGLNEAYGKTKEEALSNLESAIAQRKANKN